MKRKDLLEKIDTYAKVNRVSFEFKSAGGNHDKYTFNGRMIPIPRHREIGEGLVRTIMKQCENALPKEEK